MGAAVISELEGGQLSYIKMRMGPVSSIGHSVHAGIIELRVQMKQVIGVVLGEGDFRIGNMVQVCPEEESRAITVAAQHLSERATHDNVVIRGGRLHRGVFAGCGRGLVRDDRAAAGDWGSVTIMVWEVAMISPLRISLTVSLSTGSPWLVNVSPLLTSATLNV
jgi:hypothetical protein